MKIFDRWFCKPPKKLPAKDDTGFEGKVELTVGMKGNLVSLQFTESIKHFDFTPENARRIGQGIIDTADHIDGSKIQVTKSIPPRLIQ